MPVILFSPKRHGDNRGWFSEIYNKARESKIGINDDFVQDNQSMSACVATLRGIHFQRPPHAQAKLVRCTRGRLIDIVVDLRRNSPTYGQHVVVELSFENGKQLYIPAGFGHAFVTTEPNTEISYKVDDYYSPECDDGLRWNCPILAIDWGIDVDPVVSEKDAALPTLAEFDSPFKYDGNPLELISR